MKRIKTVIQNEPVGQRQRPYGSSSLTLRLVAPEPVEPFLVVRFALFLARNQLFCFSFLLFFCWFCLVS